MRKLKKIIIGLLTITMIGSLTGCSSTEKSNETTADLTVTPTTESVVIEAEDLSGTATITGSTSVEKILLDMIDEFTAYNTDVTINYTGTGSSAGISDTIAGANDIGASSRNLKDEEKESGLTEVVFAYDGIGVIVNPSNKVSDITLENLVKIYSGEITNWNQLGGNDGTIIVVSREGSSGTRSAFEELIKLEEEGGLTENTTVVEGNGNVQTNVAGNENAIGYVSFSYLDETVKALTIDTVEATADQAKAGTYSLSRPFIFVYNEATATYITKAFMEYVLTSEAQEFVTEHGGISID